MNAFRVFVMLGLLLSVPPAGANPRDGVGDANPSRTDTLALVRDVCAVGTTSRFSQDELLQLHQRISDMRTHHLRRFCAELPSVAPLGEHVARTTGCSLNASVALMASLHCGKAGEALAARLFAATFYDLEVTELRRRDGTISASEALDQRAYLLQSQHLMLGWFGSHGDDGLADVVLARLPCGRDVTNSHLLPYLMYLSQVGRERDLRRAYPGPDDDPLLVDCRRDVQRYLNWQKRPRKAEFSTRLPGGQFKGH